MYGCAARLSLARCGMDIEALIAWAYRDQKVHWASHVGGMPSTLSYGEDSAQRIAGMADYGCAIDISRGAGTFRAHPDAEIVHEIICEHRAGILIKYGMTGLRPDWMPNARPKLGPVYEGNKIKRCVDERTRKPIFTYVRWVLHPDQIAFARATYARWHAALVVVRGALAGQAIGPLAPSEPWAGT